ncbi:hypothetical protein Esti_002491 [Eimeria stiedai]
MIRPYESCAESGAGQGLHPQASGTNTGDQFAKSAMEEGDKDDVSDDEDEDERQAACAMKVGTFFRAIFPDLYPFIWLLLPFLICALLFLINYGKIPPGTEYSLGVESNLKVDYSLYTPPPKETGTIGALQLQKEGYLILVYWSLLAFAIWLAFMLIRVMLMVIAMNLLPYETQVLTAFITPVDPEIVYVAWSVVVYVLWKATFYEREHFIMHTEGDTPRIALYRSRLFGSLNIKQELLQEFSKLWIALIILTVRRLLLSVLTFLFEIGFMKSMNTQLVVYLSKYSIIRRLNTKWASSTNAHFARVESELLNEALKDNSTSTGQQELSQTRAGKLIVFRFRNIHSNKGHMREYFGAGMPQQLTSRLIKRTVTSGVHNWILIHYVLQYPPAFFLYGRRIELLSKSSTTTVAEQFFAGLMAAEQAHFPPSKGVDVSIEPENQEQAAADPIPNMPPSDTTKLPSLSMKLHVENSLTSNAPSAKNSLQGDPHEAAFRTEESQQVAFTDDESNSWADDAQVVSSNARKGQGSLASLASSSMEILLSHAEIRLSPSERLETVLPSQPSQTHPRSHTASLQSGSFDDQEEVVPIQLVEEPRQKAQQATSSLFNTSLPNPPWLHELYSSEPKKAAMHGRTDENVAVGRAGTAPTAQKLREAVFGKELIELYLKSDEATEFMHHVDLGGYGKINKKMLKRAFFSVYKLRKSFIKAVTNQVSICNTVEKMISLLLWVITIVGLLLLIGLNFNTVLISGAATLSALTVALSNLYKEFIGAVIFIAISNPYNVGDRIRIDYGDPLYVKRIRTYTTQFEDIYGKQVLHSNDALWRCLITNESRAKNASHNFIIRVQIETQIMHLRILEKNIKQAMDSQPMDYVKDSFLIFISDFQAGKWLEVSIWVTTVENWGNITKTLRLRTDMFLVIQSICYELGISYHEAGIPVEFERGALSDLVHSADHGAHSERANGHSFGENSRDSMASSNPASGLRRRLGGRAN